MEVARWLGVVAVAVVFFGCGRGIDVSRDTARTPSGPVSSSAPSSTPEARRAPRPIAVRNLPPSGFVTAAERGGATFVGLDGSVIDHLDGFRLAGNPDNAGVWLQRGRDLFHLGSQRADLVPVKRSQARNRIYGDGAAAPELPVPEGARYGGRVAGRWTYVLDGPAGVALAQWSGECESPTAFWVAGEDIVSLVTGKAELSGPESIALGWGRDGAAYAHLGEGLCGSRADPPGIYVFEAPGHGRLLYPTPPRARVDMW